MRKAHLPQSSWLTTHVSHHVVANDKRCWDEEPDETLEYVVDDEVTASSDQIENQGECSPRDHNEEQADMDPAEKGKLWAEILPLEVPNKSNET